MSDKKIGSAELNRKTWTVWRTDNYDRKDYHAVPDHDTSEHSLAKTCWCVPRVEEVVNRTGLIMGVVTHNSADRRELTEPDHDSRNRPPT